MYSVYENCNMLYSLIMPTVCFTVISCVVLSYKTCVCDIVTSCTVLSCVVCVTLEQAVQFYYV